MLLTERLARVPPHTLVIIGYYLATPLFALLDWIFGWNVRAAGLSGQPGLRSAYYAVCTGAGVITALRPSLSRFVGLVESSVNILLLILGVLLPYWAIVNQAGEGVSAAALPFTFNRLVNFLISGFMWVHVFHQSVDSLAGESRGWERKDRERGER
ncbi:MAG TPA: hypothetical protein VEO37_02405 [Thermoanaerobaculia bacterium]|nr:hypothetical protein [Thermoanaerobaculia bacterium]